jgi:nucleotide-binding universal stress UspA family protein
MRFKTIVTILQSEQDIERALACATELAKRHESHLVGVHAEALPIPYTSATGFPDTEFLQVSATMNKERSDRLHAAFLKALENSGLSTDWRSLESLSGDSALTGIATARAADLIVAAHHETDGDGKADIGSLVYDSGRPVLVVPHSGPIISHFRNIGLAWNGTREAARAAFDALPFMAEAEKTEILVIDPPDMLEEETTDTTSIEIAAALARHGINVSVSNQKSQGKAIEDVIQGRLAETGADLLVLGAYSHSWLRRLFFGGVTNSMLRSGQVAAFLSR